MIKKNKQTNKQAMYHWQWTMSEKSLQKEEKQQPPLNPTVKSPKSVYQSANKNKTCNMSVLRVWWFLLW